MNQEIVETNDKPVKIKKVKKPKRKLTNRDKKIIKWTSIGTLSAGSITTVTWFLVAPFSFIGEREIVESDITIVAIVFFFIGFLFTLWYPVSRLLAWMKTRKLKNQNLSKDLQLKDAKIALLESKTNPLPHIATNLVEEE